MQISTLFEDFIVDTIALRHKMYKLLSVFANKNIVKVMHGASHSDLLWLQKDFNIYLVNLFDTYDAAVKLAF